MISSTRGQEALCCTIDYVWFVIVKLCGDYGNYCQWNINYMDQSQPKNMPGI